MEQYESIPTGTASPVPPGIPSDLNALGALSSPVIGLITLYFLIQKLDQVVRSIQEENSKQQAAINGIKRILIKFEERTENIEFFLTRQFPQQFRQRRSVHEEMQEEDRSE